DEAQWRGLLDRQLATFGGAASQLGLYGATLLRAIDWALSPVTRVEVSGVRGPGAACDMHLLALQTYLPRKVVVRKPAETPAATDGIRPDVIIATKVGGNFYNRDVNPLLIPRITEALGRPLDDVAPDAALPVTHDACFSPSYIRFAVEQSLRRLRTDYVDLLQ